MKQYVKLLDEFKDQVIDHYEDWFAKEILMDISENGGVFDSLINDEYEFMFNVELSRNLQNIIEGLQIKHIEEKDEKRIDNYYKLGIEFVKLKRITDKRILESKAYNEEWVKEWLFDDIPEENESTLIELNDKLLNQESLINDVFMFLSDNNYIDCTDDLFKNHFSGKSIKDKVSWIGKQSEMAAFIQLIYDYDIISKNKERGNKIKLTCTHFYFKKNNKEFNKKSLSKEFSIFKNDETLCPELRMFFKKLLKQEKIKFR